MSLALHLVLFTSVLAEVSPVHIPAWELPLNPKYSCSNLRLFSRLSLMLGFLHLAAFTRVFYQRFQLMAKHIFCCWDQLLQELNYFSLLLVRPQ